MQCGAICYLLRLCLAGVLLRDPIMLVVAVCFANSFLTSNGKLWHITYKICNYWCIEYTVLIFIHMESTNVLWLGKNCYHMKHSNVLVGTLDHGQVPLPFSRQCSLGMWGFQIELQNKLPLYIIVVLCHKQVPLNVRRYCYTVYDLFCHTVCF
jgi:hypothetical protein